MATPQASGLRPRLVGIAMVSVLALAVGWLRAAGGGQTGREVGASPAPSDRTGLTKTSVVHVRPLDDQGHLSPGFTVSKTVDDANCPIPSVKVSGSASTCVAGEYIYDPCWVETGHPARRSVLCMSVPWSHEVSRLLTEAKVVTEAPSPDWPPWAVELADSQQCRVATGAHDSLDPSRGDDAGVVDYYCGEQEARWLGLLRGIDDTHPVWTVRAARYDNDRWESVDPQRIATAWF